MYCLLTTDSLAIGWYVLPKITQNSAQAFVARNEVGNAQFSGQ